MWKAGRTPLGRWPTWRQPLEERIPVGRLSAYLWPLRSGVTWGKGGPHSGYRHLADKDEAAGSSPARPTIPGLTCGNACRQSLIALEPVRCLRTPVSERIPALLSSDDYGSRVVRKVYVQVLWQAHIRVGGCPGPGGAEYVLSLAWTDLKAFTWSSTAPCVGARPYGAMWLIRQHAHRLSTACEQEVSAGHHDFRGCGRRADGRSRAMLQW
jgi:hypothetical protein